MNHTFDIDEEPGEEFDEPFCDDSDPIAEHRPLPLGDRCLFPGKCIAVDPYHQASECWTAELVEAYEAELRERELGAGDA